jgi:hypothetical protein
LLSLSGRQQQQSEDEKRKLFPLAREENESNKSIMRMYNLQAPDIIIFILLNKSFLGSKLV